MSQKFTDRAPGAVALSAKGLVKRFKTAPAVYELVTTAYRLYPQAVSFQSSNRWDVAGATRFGFRTVWINRNNLPDEYGDYGPSLILPSLEAL